MNTSLKIGSVARIAEIEKRLEESKKPLTIHMSVKGRFFGVDYIKKSKSITVNDPKAVELIKAGWIAMTPVLPGESLTVWVN